jgi:predicted RNase H-like HicB family nuclease
MGMVVVRTVIEYNENGFLAHVENYCGAYTRGKTRAEALGKLRGEIACYTLWATGEYLLADEPLEIKVVQEKLSYLQICDADTEVLFSTEKLPLSQEEYASLKSLVIRSARDFEQLYLSIPDKTQTALRPRQTFYDPMPRTAQEMYRHTNSVTSYYLGEIGVKAKNLANVVENRSNALGLIES